jgi:hypothetical protein
MTNRAIAYARLLPAVVYVGGLGAGCFQSWPEQEYLPIGGHVALTTAAATGTTIGPGGASHGLITTLLAAPMADAPVERVDWPLRGVVEEPKA